MADLQMMPSQKSSSGVQTYVLELGEPLSTLFDVSTPKEMLDYYDSSLSVSIPVNMIVDPFAVMEPVLRNVKTKEIMREGAIIDLMRDPSSHWQKEHFYQKLGIEYLVTGACYPVAIGSNLAPPIELASITPQDITPTMGDQGWPQHYHASGMFMHGLYEDTLIKRKHRYTKDSVSELIPIKRYSTKNNSLIEPQSVLAAAKNDILQNILGGEHNVTLLKNGGKLSLVFNFEQDLSPDDYEEMKNQINQKYGGSTKVNQIAVTAGGKLKIDQLGATNMDMDYNNMQTMVDRRIGMGYNIPLPLLSSDASTLNNYERAILSLYHSCVIPLHKTVVGGISDNLLPRYGMDQTEWRLWYDYEEVPALVMQKLEETALRVSSNIFTHDEMRGYEGKESLGKVGGVVYHNMSMVPLGEGGKPESGQGDNEPGKPQPVAGQ